MVLKGPAGWAVLALQVLSDRVSTRDDSQICILTESGEIIERRIRTERERFAAVLGERPRAKILIEASTESEWVAPRAGARPGDPLETSCW